MMLEILILSMVGLAGTALAGVFSGDDAETAPQDGTEEETDEPEEDNGFQGTVGNDLLNAGDADDSVTGKSGDDVLRMNGGDDVADEEERLRQADRTTGT